MLTVGLTGGVGSGKSTVADMLLTHGAVIIDADRISREVVVPGTVAYQAIRARFGREVLASDKTIDRKALASIVFSDDDALSDLNSIVHPFVREEIQVLQARNQDTDNVVVLVIPLLLESGHYKVDYLIVVDVSEDDAVERLISQRGWTERHARKRIAAQMTREERRSAADLVIDNSGSIEDLREQVDQAWRWIQEKRNSS